MAKHSDRTIKPGMLCFLTRCMDSENNGKLVTVVALHICGVDRPADKIAIGQQMWMVKPNSKLIGRLNGFKVGTHSLLVESKQLIPIDADPNGTENEEWLILRRESCKPMHV